MSRRKKKKITYIKEIYFCVMGFLCLFIAKFFIQPAGVQMSTKAELERLSESTSVIVTEGIVKGTPLLSNIVILVGIILIIYAIFSAVVKTVKKILDF